MVVDAAGHELPTQIEKEASNLPLDWRKRVVFAATLEPSQMNRFDCRLIVKPKKPSPRLKTSDGVIRFRNGDGLEVVINTHTGLVDKLAVGGTQCWRTRAPAAGDEGRRGPLGHAQAAASPQDRRLQASAAGREAREVFGADGKTLPRVRVIEDGAVRASSRLRWRGASLLIAHAYKLPKQGTAVQVQTWVNWNEKDRMLKLSVPYEACRKDASFRGQVAYGVGELPDNGDEAVAQKWVAVVGKGGRTR